MSNPFRMRTSSTPRCTRAHSCEFSSVSRSTTAACDRRSFAISAACCFSRAFRSTFSRLPKPETLFCIHASIRPRDQRPQHLPNHLQNLDDLVTRTIRARLQYLAPPNSKLGYFDGASQ